MGKHYFVIGMAPGFGTAVERLNVDRRAAVPLPEGAAADAGAAIAASVNPAMSSWLALKSRTAGLPQGLTALVLGATSASGELAVIGAARNPDTLARVAGLDRRIELKGENTDRSSSSSSGLEAVDVMLDYINGDVATRVLEALPVPARGGGGKGRAVCRDRRAVGPALVERVGRRAAIQEPDHARASSPSPRDGQGDARARRYPGRDGAEDAQAVPARGV